LAIADSPEERATLSDIYAWIQKDFPFYKTAETGWKVQIKL
jgi:hypothetical protein